MKNKTIIRLIISLVTLALFFGVINHYNNYPLRWRFLLEAISDQPFAFAEKLTLNKRPGRGVCLLDRASGERKSPWLDIVFQPLNEHDTLTVFVKKNKRGYLNLNSGNIQMEPTFDYAWHFSEGKATVVLNNRLGFINTLGEYILPPVFTFTKSLLSSPFLFREGYCLIPDSIYGGSVGLIDKNFIIKLSPVYKSIIKINGFFVIQNQTFQYGLVDSNFREQLACIYDEIHVHDKLGIVVKKGPEQKLLSFNFQPIGTVFNSVYTLSGATDELYTLMEDHTSPLEKSLYSAYYISGEGCGLLNNKGMIVSLPLYDEIEIYKERPLIFRARFNNYYMLIDSKGKPIV
jgi:hypothetical protein